LVVFWLGTPRVMVLASPARCGTLLVSAEVLLPAAVVPAEWPIDVVLSVVCALVVLAFGTPLVMVLASPARCGTLLVSLAPARAVAERFGLAVALSVIVAEGVVVVVAVSLVVLAFGTPRVIVLASPAR